MKKTQIPMILTTEKPNILLNNTRVMTLAVCRENIPWSAPVYFVFNDKAFYFFSNKNSEHIRAAKEQSRVAASIFHDSDKIEKIFGFQMSGTISRVTEKSQYLKIIKLYTLKFDFLKKIFGQQIIENSNFFSETFKSQLYYFQPDKIYLSDNSQKSGKKSEIKPASLGGT